MDIKKEIRNFLIGFGCVFAGFYALGALLVLYMETWGRENYEILYENFPPSLEGHPLIKDTRLCRGLTRTMCIETVTGNVFIFRGSHDRPVLAGINNMDIHCVYKGTRKRLNVQKYGPRLPGFPNAETVEQIIEQEALLVDYAEANFRVLPSINGALNTKATAPFSCFLIPDD